MYQPTKASDPYCAIEELFRKRDWSKIQDDILRLIAEKLRFTIYHCRFAADCRDWYRIAREAPCPFQQNSLLALIPHNDKIETGKCSLYQISDSTTFELYVPELKDKYIHCCSKGWLAVSNDDFELSLVNILTREQIKVPEPSYALDLLEEMIEPENMHNPSIRDGWMKKLVVSGSPSSSEGCSVAAIMSFHYKPFFCRLGDESWTRIRLTNCKVEYPDQCRFHEEIIFFGGKLYSARGTSIIVVDIDEPDFKSQSILGPKRKDKLELLRVYVVECSGSLLFVCKIGEISLDGKSQKTRSFEVYKLDKDADTWSVMSELGDHSLFLGANESVAVLAGEIPWCRPNCVYYVDDVWGGEECQGDNGLFSLENGNIEMLSISTRRVSSSMWYHMKK